MCALRPSKSSQPSVEIADIFRQHGDAYSQANVLTPEQYKVLHAIQNCRTSMLGGHLYQCDQCAAQVPVYNSCRNRHCPKCDTLKAASWLEERQAELLPVSYFHVVFTLPHELNPLVNYNKKTLYHLLFQSAWKTLKTLGIDPKRLGGEMGMLAILHTWGQNLCQHNHLHCIVPGGALKKNGQWKSAKKYLFPVQVLSTLFRGIYVSELRACYQKKQLTLPTSSKSTFTSTDFDSLLDQLMQKDWVVYAKPPFAGPESVLNYLGRYTHKIAISNARILACDDRSVTFKWRDYSDDNKEKIMTLRPEEFIRRFLSHVLPSGFMRIRSFGFLANACKAKKVKKIQTLLKFQIKKIEKRDTVTRMLELTGKDIQLCPVCKNGKLNLVKEIPSQLNNRSNTIWDTS